MHARPDKETKTNLKIFCAPLLQKFQNWICSRTNSDIYHQGKIFHQATSLSTEQVEL